MNIILQSLLLTISLLASVIAQPRVKEFWASSRTFRTPESVLYVPETDQLFIANINGKPLDADGNGFISTMSTDGTIGKLKWITGLNAPKGMGYFGNTLYVTDITEVVEIDIPSAKITGRYPAENAVFLNDIAIDKKGILYVSDYSKQNSALYRIKDGSITLWLKTPDVSVPNGLYLDDTTLYFGSTGDGALKAVTITTKEIRTVINPEMGIDGMKPFHGSGFLLSDWAGKTVFADTNDAITVLINTTDKKINAADFEYIPEKQLLFIPTFFDNRIVAYKISR